MDYYGYCVKCSAKKKLIDPMPYKKPNSRSRNRLINMIRGRCPDCDSVVYVIDSHG